MKIHETLEQDILGMLDFHSPSPAPVMLVDAQGAVVWINDTVQHLRDCGHSQLQACLPPLSEGRCVSLSARAWQVKTDLASVAVRIRPHCDAYVVEWSWLPGEDAKGLVESMRHASNAHLSSVLLNP